MFLEKFSKKTVYERQSKLGRRHTYSRTKTIFRLACDNCGEEFFRTPKSMQHKRISNNFFHVCGNCDAKRFAQKKGVEQKKIWDMPAGTDLPISRF